MIDDEAMSGIGVSGTDRIQNFGMLFIREFHLCADKQMGIAQTNQEEINLFLISYNKIGERVISSHLAQRAMELASRA